MCFVPGYVFCHWLSVCVCFLCSPKSKGLRANPDGTGGYQPPAVPACGDTAKLKDPRVSQEKPRSCFPRVWIPAEGWAQLEDDLGQAARADAGGDTEQVLWQPLAPAPMNGASSPRGVRGSLPPSSPRPGSGVSVG